MTQPKYTVSVSLSTEVIEWLDSKIVGERTQTQGTRSAVIRRIIEHAFRKESGAIYKSKTKKPVA